MDKSLDLKMCFAEAWRGFKGWWIPLCIVAALVVVLSQTWLLVRLLGPEWHTVASQYQSACSSLAAQVVRGEDPIEANDAFMREMASLFSQPAPQRLLLKVLWFAVALALAICILHVVMVLMSKASVQVRKEDITLKQDLPRSAVFTLSYIVLAFIKMVLIICCCVLPGLYLYMRLYFTDFIITDASPNPFTACAESWRLTRGNQLKIMLLFAVTLLTHVMSILTMGIAEIPGRPFEYTLRAAAYRQLKRQQP